MLKLLDKMVTHFNMVSKQAKVLGPCLTATHCQKENVEESSSRVIDQVEDIIK